MLEITLRLLFKGCVALHVQLCWSLLVTGSVKLTQRVHVAKICDWERQEEAVGAATSSRSEVQHWQVEEFVELGEEPKQAHCWALSGVLEVVVLKKNLFTQSHLSVPLTKFVALVIMVVALVTVPLTVETVVTIWLLEEAGSWPA